MMFCGRASTSTLSPTSNAVAGLTAAIYTALQDPNGDSTVVRLSIVSVVLALGALVVSEALARRARARIGQGRVEA